MPAAVHGVGDFRYETHLYAIRCSQSDQISSAIPRKGSTIEGVHGRNKGRLDANFQGRQFWTLPAILLGIQLLISAWRGRTDKGERLYRQNVQGCIKGESR